MATELTVKAAHEWLDSVMSELLSTGDEYEDEDREMIAGYREREHD